MGGATDHRPLDAAAFRRALGRFGCGITVITTRTVAGDDYAMTASAFSSLSLDPPLVMIAVRKESRMHAHLCDAKGFAVNVLSESQEELSNRFAGILVHPDGSRAPWPESRSKFDGLAFESGPVSGAALIHGSLVALDCSRHRAHEGGDHTIFVGKVESARLCEDEALLRPLLYFAGSYRQLDRDPEADALLGLQIPGWLD